MSYETLASLTLLIGFVCFTLCIMLAMMTALYLHAEKWRSIWRNEYLNANDAEMRDVLRLLLDDEEEDAG